MYVLKSGGSADVRIWESSWYLRENIARHVSRWADLRWAPEC